MNSWSATIVEELRALKEQGATGTYYIASSDNKQVRLGIVNGDVATISVRAPTLASAIDAIVGLNIARTRFTADGLTVASGIGNIRLTTDKFCHALLQGASLSTSSAPPDGPKTRPASPDVSLSKAQEEAIRRLLIEYMGPIGDIIYDEHRNAAKSLEQLLTTLAEEIPDAHNAAQFIIRVNRHLKPAD